MYWKWVTAVVTAAAYVCVPEPIPSRIRRRSTRENGVGIHTSKFLLDVGCGIGDSTRHLKEENPHHLVLGIDRNPHAVSLARNRAGKEITFFTADARATEFKSGTFERIHFHLAMVYIDTTDLPDICREMRRILCPHRGKVIIKDYALGHPFLQEIQTLEEPFRSILYPGLKQYDPSEIYRIFASKFTPSTGAIHCEEDTNLPIKR